MSERFQRSFIQSKRFLAAKQVVEFDLTALWSRIFHRA